MNFFFQLKKYTRILIALNIILFLILVFFNIPKTEPDVLNTSFLLKESIKNIDEIIFTIPDNSLPPRFNELKLIKKNDKFILQSLHGEYKVQAVLIERLFSVLTAKQDFRFIGDDVKQYINFGLDEEHAARLKFLRADKTIIGEFVFGKNDTLGINRYVRIDSRTKIYTTADNLAPFLTIRPNFWLDLQIYKYRFDKNLIQSIEKNNKHIIRSDKNGRYFYELELFLKQFSCIDIFPASPLTNSDSEYLTLTLGSGEKIRIGFTPMESGDFILFEANSPNVYVVSGYTKRRIDSILNFIF